MRTAAICPTCATYINAACVVYNGPNLTNINVTTLDNLEDVIQNINDNLVPIYGSGAPTNSAVYEGQIYIDNATGEIYIATNTGGGPADWDQLALQSALPATPSLDDVLTVGNTSTQNIVIQDLLVAPTQIVTIQPNNVFIEDTSLDLQTAYNVNNILVEDVNTGDQLQINIDNLQNQVIDFPSSSGTLALLTDIPSGWRLTGNSGTTPGTNFIGTTDSQDLIFKTNSVESLKILSTGDVFSKKDISVVANSNATQTRFQVYQPTGFYSASIGQNTSRGGYLQINGTTGFNEAVLLAQNLTASRTFQFPDADGTLALKSDLPQYKSYVATISQTGITPPTEDYILENTLSGSPTWGYNAVGRYTITLSLAWTNNKTIVFVNPGYIPQGFTVGWERNSSSTITIHVRDAAGNYTDGLLFKASVEVRVYN